MSRISLLCYNAVAKHHQTAAPPASGEAASAESEVRFSGPVLIVDDEQDDVLFATRRIEELDLPRGVFAVTSGKELIDYLQGEGPYSDRAAFPYPRLILLDLKMPNMDGFEILAWMRSRPQYRDLHVIVLTGVGQWQHVARAYRLGACSFLTKPLSCADFLTTISALGLVDP
jgi:CheY-like chemotaxis protein